MLARTHSTLTDKDTHTHTHLNRGAPANNESRVVLPAETARVHVRPQADVVSQHVGDSLSGADVEDLHPLMERLTDKHCYPADGHHSRDFIEP